MPKGARTPRWWHRPAGAESPAPSGPRAAHAGRHAPGRRSRVRLLRASAVRASRAAQPPARSRRHRMPRPAAAARVKRFAARSGWWRGCARRRRRHAVRRTAPARLAPRRGPPAPRRPRAARGRWSPASARASQGTAASSSDSASAISASRRTVGSALPCRRPAGAASSGSVPKFVGAPGRSCSSMGQAGGRRRLDDAAGPRPHHQHPVAQEQRLVDVLCDEDHGGAVARQRIQRAKGLVHQQHARMAAAARGRGVQPASTTSRVSGEAKARTAGARPAPAAARRARAGRPRPPRCPRPGPARRRS